MPRRASFKLLVLLSGPGHGVLGKGRLRRGQVVRETRRSSPRGAEHRVRHGARPAGRCPVRGAPRPGTGYPAVLPGRAPGHPGVHRLRAGRHAGRPGIHRCLQDASISVTGTATFNGLNALASPAWRRADRHVGRHERQQAISGLVGHPGRGDHLRRGGQPAGARVQPDDCPDPGHLPGPHHQLAAGWRREPVISIVARSSTSGTRRTFDSTVLGGATEPPASSFNCLTRNAIPSSRVIRCEVGDTGTLLQRVNTIPGAIGYAQTGRRQLRQRGESGDQRVDRGDRRRRAGCLRVLDGRAPVHLRAARGRVAHRGVLGLHEQRYRQRHPPRRRVHALHGPGEAKIAALCAQ